MNKNNLNEIFAKTEALFAIYRNGLLEYSDEDFFYKSSPETWSLAQMYEHVCLSGKKFFLANTKRCMEQRNGQLGGEKNAAGENVFKYGGFPPMKFKVPAGLNALEIVGRDKSAYISEIEAIIISAKLMIEPINQDPGEYKTLHPVLGWLNAAEWYQNLEMHTRHHLRQKEELENLAKNG